MPAGAAPECVPDPVRRGISITAAPPAIEPDLTWYDNDDKPVAVIDAKYKTITAGKRGPNADMYQLTAYCSPLGLRGGHLIYEKGDTASHAVEAVSADITIYCHALDPTTPRRRS